MQNPSAAMEVSDEQIQSREVSVPLHRYTPLKKSWIDIYTPIHEEMKIDVSINLKSLRVELKTRPDTPDISNLQKSADFVHAFTLGFDLVDAAAILRMDELHLESFEMKDVRRLSGKKKFAIENSTRSRIVIGESEIHILGSPANIKVARESICKLNTANKVLSVFRKILNFYLCNRV